MDNTNFRFNNIMESTYRWNHPLSNVLLPSPACCSPLRPMQVWAL